MLAGVILAGGQSRRMGTDKLALELNGQTLLQRTADLLSEIGAGQLFISGDTPVPVSQPVTIIPDLDEPALGGPPRGLYSVLCWLEAEGQLDGRSLLVLTGDMPLLNRPVLQRLVSMAGSGRAVRFSDEVFPFLLHADDKALFDLRALVREGSAGSRVSIKKLLETWQAVPVDAAAADKEIFSNINTPEDWRQVVGRKTR